MFSNEDFASWLIDESPGAAVVLGGALVDEELLLLLLRALKPVAGREDNLFDPERPLGAFSARIKLAWRLSIIDDECMRGLNILRDLRNEVAHGVQLTSLSNGSIRDRVTNLAEWVATNGRYASALEALREARPESDPILRQFVSSIVGIVMRLRNARKNIEPLRASHCVTIEAKTSG
ncbi:hypothetical protein [Burkholderia gladioli]|uniref:hypothetical protein n=1 Tax=Burkholderia gladioli TaxID=28095 RepID=UPI002030429A|nr:hypothetical protein [Burkholderia gladioli]URV23836.1 hypothetical protein NAL90_13095 [Burkholderia gladioli]